MKWGGDDWVGAAATRWVRRQRGAGVSNAVGVVATRWLPRQRCAGGGDAVRAATARWSRGDGVLTAATG